MCARPGKVAALAPAAAWAARLLAPAQMGVGARGALPHLSLRSASARRRGCRKRQARPEREGEVAQVCCRSVGGGVTRRRNAFRDAGWRPAVAPRQRVPGELRKALHAVRLPSSNREQALGVWVLVDTLCLATNPVERGATRGARACSRRCWIRVLRAPSLWCVVLRPCVCEEVHIHSLPSYSITRARAFGAEARDLFATPHQP